MSYYKKVLQPDEAVLVVGRLHWIIYGRAVAFLVLAAAVLVAAPLAPGAETAVEILAASCAVLALLVFLRAWIIRVTTEVAVTNRRIIHKRGVISRHTEEMNISKVETVDVDQGIWGRVLGYGTVVVRGTGGGWEPLRRLASPLTIRNAIVVG